VVSGKVVTKVVDEMWYLRRNVKSTSAHVLHVHHALCTCHSVDID